MSRFGNLEFAGESDGYSGLSSTQLKDATYYFAEARSAFEVGKFESALRLYSKVLEFNPQIAAAWTGQVRMLIELGEFHEATLWADKALELFPHEPDLLAAKAVALARKGDLQAALVFSDASMEEQGDSPYVWLARGDVLLARKEQRADYCFERALLIAPHDWFIAWLAARIRCFYAQFALALQILQRAVEWDSTNFLLWLHLGQCQQALGLLSPARVSFSLARQLNPQCDDVSTALAGLPRIGLAARVRGLWRRFFN